MTSNCWSITIWTIFVTFQAICQCVGSSVPFDFKHVQILTPESLTAIQQTPHVSVVYYYKRDLPRLRAFFKELDKSAEYLEIYGTKTGLLDCTKVGEDVGNCNVPRVEHNVYSYRDGGSLLTLELETMFDVNSIMSNILQLILLHEVPIVQSRSDRQQLEVQYRGKSDIIFSFHKAIGTYEHRVFMEVAYAYQDHYKFGITTETKTAEGLKEVESVTSSTEAAVWVLYCRDVDEEGQGCPSVRYRGKMDLPSLAVFLKALSLPRIFELPAHGSVPTCRKEKFTCVFLYYDFETKEQVMEAAEALKFKIYGVAGIVVVDTDKVEEEMRGSHGIEELPAISVLRKEQDTPTVMGEEWSLDNIANFMQHVLFDEEPVDLDTESSHDEGSPEQVSHGTADPKELEKAGYDLPTVEEVETQDDQVAEAVFQLNRVPMKLNLVPALTDKTFPTTVQERDLVSVLFYLPFDSRSMAFLRAYGEASFSLEDKEAHHNPLVRVNCYDWTDICGEQNVSSYPTVRFFRQGQDPMDYKGALDTQAVVSTVKLLQQDAPMMLWSQEEAQNFVGGKLPENITSYTNMSVLGLFENDKQGLVAFQEASRILHNMTVFAYMTGDMAKHIAEQLGQSSPCVLVFRHDDPYSDSKALSGDLTTENIIDLVKQSRIPTLPELTMEIFPLLYSEDRPIFILFCDKYEISETENIKQVIVGLTSSFPGIIFTWMHARGSSVGATVFSEYTLSSNLPALSVIYHRTGKLYNKIEGEFTSDAIRDWLNGVVSGQEEPSKVLPKGDWKPAGRGYDFLALFEFESRYGENALHNSPADNIRTAEEYGAGFNSDGSEIEYNEKSEHSMEGDGGDSSIDDEIRSELLELSKSRLYHHVSDRRREEGETTAKTHEKMDNSIKHAETKSSKQHPTHTEL